MSLPELGFNRAPGTNAAETRKVLTEPSMPPSVNWLVTGLTSYSPLKTTAGCGHQWNIPGQRLLEPTAVSRLHTRSRASDLSALFLDRMHATAWHHSITGQMFRGCSYYGCPPPSRVKGRVDGRMGSASNNFASKEGSHPVSPQASIVKSDGRASVACGPVSSHPPK